MARTPTADLPTDIVAAGRRVLARTGPHGLTIRQVAAEARVSVQSIYNRFGTKDALLDDLATDGFRRLIEIVMDPCGSPLTGIDDPLPVVIEVFRRHRCFARAEPRLYRFLFGDRPISWEPSVRTTALFEETVALGVRAISLAIDAGVLLPGDPEDVAGRLMATARGAMELGFDQRRFDTAMATTIRGLRPSAQLR